MTLHFHTYTDYEEYKNLDFQDRLKNYLHEKEILKVPVELAEDLVVDARYFLHEFIFDESMTVFWGRKTLLDKLAKIDDLLESKYGARLKIYELYRPLSLQKELFTQIKSDIIKKHPKLNEEEIWAKTTEFIADPDLCPPHSTGGAVDLVIVDSKNGKPWDFGTEINSIDDKSNLFASDISDEAFENRQLLLSLMLEEQIAPMCTEWWHFSYGDAYWAAIYNEPRIYDSLDL